ncbi:MAG: multicopper oxidase domain-containing protein [Gemmatimonadaceae bacterium]|nr:multicopper oxidase domain-containing protein [Gemmatimonadaceae bacterium]
MRPLLPVVLAAFAMMGRPATFAATPRRSAPLPLAQLEDNRRAAGARIADTLRVSLSIREVRWRPEGSAGAELNAFAFVEDGQPAKVPGPLLRAPAGTSMHVTLHNTLSVQLVVFGLHDHAANQGVDSITLAAGGRATVLFRVTSAGTYYYWARVRPAVQHPTAPVPDDWPSGEKGEGPLVGALIVDTAGTVPPRGERILLISRWLDDDDARVHHDPAFKMMINGASWPNTERLRYTAGETVRWRVINASAAQHPMHLHGFYFTVTSRGDGNLDSLYTPSQQRRVVTEMLPGNGTMSLTWVPERPGNWLFHCHLVRHMALVQRIEPRAGTTAGGHAMSSVHHAEENMAGLVMGIQVAPRAGAAAARSLALAAGRNPGAPAMRSLRVVATQRANVFGSTPGHSFIWQQGSTTPARDSMQFPGSTLVLRRGEPTAITVVNRLSSPLAVHWHGMEIESWFDGVGGWSGAGRSVRPPIAPGDSFVVRLTPARAGTFIYHTHDEAGSELSTGLYGALIVEEPNTPRDTTRDHVIVMGLLGDATTGALAINGRTEAVPLTLTPGKHRLRFVSIPVDEQIRVAFVRDSVVQQWRSLAIDGADLPSGQQATGAARRTVSAGQTFDVEVTIPGGAPADYALRFTTFWYPTDPRGRNDAPVLRVPIVIRQP